MANLFDHVQVSDADGRRGPGMFEVRFRFSAAGQDFQINDVVDGDSDEAVVLCARLAREGWRRRILELGAQFSTPRGLEGGGEDGRV